jgi:hypothetical protein
MDFESFIRINSHIEVCVKEPHGYNLFDILTFFKEIIIYIYIFYQYQY